MARKADTPCAGGCGRLLWTGRGSLPDPTCRECRKSGQWRSAHLVVCRACECAFISQTEHRPFCSLACFHDFCRKYPTERERYYEKTKRWRAANPDKIRESRRRASSKRRARLRGVESEPYTLQELCEESGGVCCLCEQPVDMTLSPRDPWGPVVDHALPLSLGGDDTIENVQLAHYTCNGIKHNNPWAFLPA